MRRYAPLAASIIVAALVLPVLVTTSLRLVVNDWIVDFEYRVAGVPADRYGLTREERTELARIGLDAITPGTAGVELLRTATLPDGEPAFTSREIAHMDDVRTLVGALLALQAWAMVGLAAGAAVLALPRTTRAIVPRGLRWGVAGSLVVAAVLGVLMLAAWGLFFEQFHGVFFAGDSWRFRRTDTLLRLYPNEFWMGTAAWLSALTVLLAGALWVLAGRWLRAVSPVRR